MFLPTNKKKETIFNAIPAFNALPTQKKEFRTMLNLLNDAEKYDSAEEFGVSDMLLRDLIKYIEEYVKI